MTVGCVLGSVKIIRLKTTMLSQTIDVLQKDEHHDHGTTRLWRAIYGSPFVIDRLLGRVSPISESPITVMSTTFCVFAFAGILCDTSVRTRRVTAVAEIECVHIVLGVCYRNARNEVVMLTNPVSFISRPLTSKSRVNR